MMINGNLNRLGINQMRSWKVALREYLRAHYADQIGDAGEPSSDMLESS